MRNYDVYALGNALVDMEYAVEPQDLLDLAIDKGVMTLVDEAHQLRIMRHLRARHHQRGSGGSAANSVIALTQFGGTGFYSCKVADDELGHFYMRDLVAGGVDTLGAHTFEAGHTGRCVVLVTPDSDRTMCTHLGVSSHLSMRELDIEAIRGARYCYIEGYLVTSDSARAAAIEARRVAEESGVKTALSLSDPNMVKFFKDGLRRMLGERVDLVFANEAEARGMADADDLDEAIDYMKSIAREFAITRGPLGALVWDGRELVEIDPVRVEAIDTVGAGDMFAGAFLFGLTRGWSHRRAGELAAAAAARLVTRRGPRIGRAETQDILRGVERDT